MQSYLATRKFLLTKDLTKYWGIKFDLVEECGRDHAPEVTKFGEQILKMCPSKRDMLLTDTRDSKKKLAKLISHITPKFKGWHIYVYDHNSWDDDEERGWKKLFIRHLNNFWAYQPKPYYGS